MNKKAIVDYQALRYRIGEYAKKVGRMGTRPLLLLFYVMTDPDTPRSDKLFILSAISYLILPVDVVSSRRLPLIGWIDEVISLTVAYKKVCKHITPEMERKADELLDKWFPERLEVVKL